MYIYIYVYAPKNETGFLYVNLQLTLKWSNIHYAHIKINDQFNTPHLPLCFTFSFHGYYFIKKQQQKTNTVSLTHSKRDNKKIIIIWKPVRAGDCKDTDCPRRREAVNSR